MNEDGNDGKNRLVILFAWFHLVSYSFLLTMFTSGRKQQRQTIVWLMRC